MILLNFSHPLNPAHQARIEALSGKKIERNIDLPVQFDGRQPYAEQIIDLVNAIPLQPRQWQKEALLVNPPAFNFITAVLLAELHGRMGYFPPVVRLRPVEGSLPPEFEVAEIVNLQEIRDAARQLR